jgi:hypothetical protein
MADSNDDLGSGTEFKKNRHEIEECDCKFLLSLKSMLTEETFTNTRHGERKGRVTNLVNFFCRSEHWK